MAVGNQASIGFEVPSWGVRPSAPVLVLRVAISRALLLSTSAVQGADRSPTAVTNATVRLHMAAISDNVNPYIVKQDMAGLFNEMAAAAIAAQPADLHAYLVDFLRKKVVYTFAPSLYPS